MPTLLLRQLTSPFQEATLPGRVSATHHPFLFRCRKATALWRQRKAGCSFAGKGTAASRSGDKEMSPVLTRSGRRHNRLKLVRDEDGRILKRMDYQYQQPNNQW